MSNRPKLFISEPGKNNDFTITLLNHLDEVCDVYYPRRDLGFGEDWFVQTIRKIKSSEVLLVLLNEATEKSDNIRREVDIARGANVGVIPVFVTKTQFDRTQTLERLGLPYHHYHQFDLDDYDTAITGLIDAIHRVARSTRMNQQIPDSEWFRPMFGRPSADPQFQCDIFMVMPFAEQFQPTYSDHIIPIAESKKLKIKRGDDFFANHSIMTDIWSALFASKLVIADCTGKNPNVFYELGIAHTIGRPVILIAQDIDDIPFDLRHLRVIIYEYTPPGMKKLEEKLADAITKML